MLKSFVVVIPSYNNAVWCPRNLDSVLNQDYPLFRVIYVDDASTDDTSRLVGEHLAARARADRVTFLQNEFRAGAAANIDRAVRSCDPSEIVVLVDGDDFLAHRQVLARLNAIYQDPDVWVTWGQFTRFPQGSEGFCAPIPSEIVSANAFRDYPFVASHLRTFYAGLYHRIRPVDVQDSDGRFFATAGDVAHMFTLMEMAGPRARFVAEVLYLYNRENPLNDDKVDRAAQHRTEMEIRGKARYGRVASLADPRTPREFYLGTGVGHSLFELTGQLPDVDQRRRPFRQMRAVLNRLGYTVRETQTLADIEDPHTIVVFDVRPGEIERLAAYSRDMLSLVLWKGPISAPLNFDAQYHQPFGRIYTWCNDLVDNVRYFKLHFPFLRPMIDAVVPFENRKLCTLIASHRHADHPDELYSEEREAARFFAEAEPDSFDLFGLGWHPIVDANYRGAVLRRVDRLRRYRFNFCYETVKGWSGFVTGKIFDSFEAGCVPVYWGAPDIADSIPSDCFIARNEFRSNAALHAFMRDMPAEVHQGYVDRIRVFLSSERAVRYSAEHLALTFVDLVAGRARPRAGGLSDRIGVDAVGAAT
ncbi:MAG: glycosyltransferase family 2 protein [Deltaproteobacteria bacterium]|nr:glycosyltransferase family 2 protein [Deltaproteobacteria bacterium]MBI3387143.1 glycosyltransferase family 2 protein [Deltaproteobacteria bacterium]